MYILLMVDIETFMFDVCIIRVIITATDIIVISHKSTTGNKIVKTRW